MDHFFHIQWLGQMCVHVTDWNPLSLWLFGFLEKINLFFNVFCANMRLQQFILILRLIFWPFGRSFFQK